MTSSMAYTPEPIHLSAQDAGTGLVKVVRGDEFIVAHSNSADFVKDALHFLKTSGEHPDTQVVILGVCSNVAFNGALKHAPPGPYRPQDVASERSAAPLNPLRIAARPLLRPLGRAEARRRDHLLDLDGRQPFTTHGLSRAARG
jgi:hypothetical protein